jgi:hypothetical protein
MTLVSFGSSAISPKVGHHVSRTQVRPVFMGNGSLPAVLKHLAAQPAIAKANPVQLSDSQHALTRVSSGTGFVAPSTLRHLAKHQTQAAADCTPIAVMMGAGYCPAAIRHLDKQR